MEVVSYDVASTKARGHLDLGWLCHGQSREGCKWVMWGPHGDRAPDRLGTEAAMEKVD